MKSQNEIQKTAHANPDLLGKIWSRTGRNLSPLLRQELANLNDDSDSRKSAMKTLKSYVIGLDSMANPQFHAQLKLSVLMERLRIVVPKKSPKSRTGRNLSPLLRQELANLNDDSDSRKSAMKALKSYVIGLDSNANPQFRAQVCSTEIQGNISNLRSRTGRNLSPLLRQELANLNDDSDSRKSAMKTLKSYVIGLDSKANPQFHAQVSFTEIQGNISNLTCSRIKQRKRKKETQKTAHENQDLRGKNLLKLSVLMENPTNCGNKKEAKGNISNLTCSRTKQRKREKETQKTAHQNPDLRGKNLLKLAILMENPTNCGNKKEAKQELANLDDDGDSSKSAMKTLKSYVIGLDSKATPQVLAQVSSAKFQGKISNLRCSRTKQRKRGNDTQKTTHENPDLRGKNLLKQAALMESPSNCGNKKEAKLKLAALIESPSNCGNKKEAKVKNRKKSESITAARIGKS
ncbi:hypothetical protein OIU78_023716 [Salix suchowensis]|nr:hypothetical protein OIU78_023716 [Salix suchowensis]